MFGIIYNNIATTSAVQGIHPKVSGPSLFAVTATVYQTAGNGAMAGKARGHHGMGRSVSTALMHPYCQASRTQSRVRERGERTWRDEQKVPRTGPNNPGPGLRCYAVKTAARAA